MIETDFYSLLLGEYSHNPETNAMIYPKSLYSDFFVNDVALPIRQLLELNFVIPFGTVQAGCIYPSECHLGGEGYTLIASR